MYRRPHFEKIKSRLLEARRFIQVISGPREEVDFVLIKGDKIIGIEVKSGASSYHSGIASFKGKYHPEKVLLVGKSGFPLEAFLRMEPADLF